MHELITRAVLWLPDRCVDIVEGITSLCRRHPWLWWVIGGIVSIEWGVFVWMTW